MKSLCSNKASSAIANRSTFLTKEGKSFFLNNNNAFFPQKNAISTPALSCSSVLANGYNNYLQRQRAEGTTSTIISEDQISSAIRYNRFMYPPAQMRMLQRALQITETGRSDRETAIAVAEYQDRENLTVDGMAGPNTFTAIHADPTILDKDDLILFSINVRNGIALTTGGGTMDMLGHFNVEVHLPPGNCDEYEYRQYICGEVEFQPAGGTSFISLNNLFTTQPGGSLPHIPNFHQDGNTALNARYGHRNRPPLPENRYIDASGKSDQVHGCTFLGEDSPGINGRITNSGETYDFDLRFMGEVRHKTRGRVAERWWNIQDTFVI